MECFISTNPLPGAGTAHVMLLGPHVVRRLRGHGPLRPLTRHHIVRPAGTRLPRHWMPFRLLNEGIQSAG